MVKARLVKAAAMPGSSRTVACFSVLWK